MKTDLTPPPPPGTELSNWCVDTLHPEHKTNCSNCLMRQEPSYGSCRSCVEHGFDCTCACGPRYKEDVGPMLRSTTALVVSVKARMTGMQELCTKRLLETSPFDVVISYDADGVHPQAMLHAQRKLPGAEVVAWTREELLRKYSKGADMLRYRNNN